MHARSARRLVVLGLVLAGGFAFSIGRSSRAAEPPCSDPNICPADVYLQLREKFRAETDATKKEALEKEIRGLELRLGFVAVHAECEKADDQLRVTVDGKVVPSGGPIPMTPGVHDVIVSCPKSNTQVKKQLQISKEEKVDLQIPVNAWDPAKPAGASSSSPQGCGCHVVGATR
jgi:hypothetical protein